MTFFSRFTAFSLFSAWERLSADERRRQSRAMAVYAAMIDQMDFHSGRVIDYLEHSGQL